MSSPINQQRHSRNSSLSPSLKTQTTTISHPSSSKIHPPLTNTSFFLLIRTYTKDGTDMVSELSKNVLNDFDLKYNKSQIINGHRRSVRLLDSHDRRKCQPNTTFSIDATVDTTVETTVNATVDETVDSLKGNILASFHRCLLEDFMVLQKDTRVLVLIPFKIECNCLLNDSFWSSIDSDTMMNYKSMIQFKKNKYHCLSATIATNPKRDSILSGITQYDFMDGLGSNNSGCLVDFGVDAENFTILKLVTWNMVFKGGIVGLQVWSQRKDIRNLGTAFNNRKKTNI